MGIILEQESSINDVTLKHVSHGTLLVSLVTQFKIFVQYLKYLESRPYLGKEKGEKWITFGSLFDHF